MSDSYTDFKSSPHLPKSNCVRWLHLQCKVAPKGSQASVGYQRIFHLAHSSLCAIVVQDIVDAAGDVLLRRFVGLVEQRRLRGMRLSQGTHTQEAAGVGTRKVRLNPSGRGLCAGHGHTHVYVTDME